MKSENSFVLENNLNTSKLKDSCCGGGHNKHGNGNGQQGSGRSHSSSGHGNQGDGNKSGSKYQCPMKCEGDKTYDSPLNCPVCNMKLVEVDSGKDSNGCC